MAPDDAVIISGGFVMRSHLVKSAVCAGVFALAMGWSGVAPAADIDEYYHAPIPRMVQEPYPVYPAPRYSSLPRPPAPIEGEDCRVIHQRQVDSYGRPVIRRLRVCDEGVVERYSERGPYPRPGQDGPRYNGPRYDGPGYDDPGYDGPDYRRQPGPRGERDYPDQRY
jgi:hypothetical protein